MIITEPVNGSVSDIHLCEVIEMSNTPDSGSLSPSMKFLLNSIMEMLNGEGVNFDIGCSEGNLERCLTRAKSMCNGKPVRVMKEWQWWDFNEKYLIEGDEEKFIPALIFGQIVSDSAHRFREGQLVRTTPIIALHDNTIIETWNTLYILLGSGIRKTVDLRLVLLMHY